MHTHTHTHTHTQTHRYTHTHTHRYAHTHTHTHTHARTHARTHTYTGARAHTYEHDLRLGWKHTLNIASCKQSHPAMLKLLKRRKHQEAVQRLSTQYFIIIIQTYIPQSEKKYKNLATLLDSMGEMAVMTSDFIISCWQ